MFGECHFPLRNRYNAYDILTKIPYYLFQRDSGSPLVTLNNVQLGVLSFGNPQCGLSNEFDPNVYSSVEYFQSWIENNSQI